MVIADYKSVHAKFDYYPMNSIIEKKLESANNAIITQITNENIYGIQIYILYTIHQMY